MQSALRDLRLAARSPLRSPGLTILSVIALGIGIGLTTTMFSIIYGALLRGLPLPEPERVVSISRTNPSRGIDRMPAPIHDFNDWVAAQHSFSALGGSYTGTVNVSGTERAERYTGRKRTPTSRCTGSTRWSRRSPAPRGSSACSGRCS